ncbi:MAG: MFS transporter [Deltaproteobacteria bacterium]|nr:MFS transporter [Deltaproteobacteria bacterium]
MADSRLYTPVFFAMALANFCILSGFGAFFMFPLYLVNAGGSESDVGIVMGASALASVLFRPWISQMVDRMGRKRCYSVGLMMMVVAPLAYLFLNGDVEQVFAPLVAVRIFHGAGFAVCITAAFTYVADIVPKNRLNEGIGIFGVSGLTGAAIGPALAEIIIRQWDFETLFIAAGGAAFLGFLFHLPVPESCGDGCSRVQSSTFLELFRRSRVMTSALLSLLFGVGLAASNTFVSPFAYERNLGFISVYYIAYSSAAVLTRIIGARIADRLGEDRVIPYALAVTGGGLVSTILVTGSGLLAVSGFVTGVGHGFLYPCLSALALRGEPVGVRGRITGIFTGSIDAGVFGGSVILGYVGSWAGFSALFAAAGSALVLAMCFFRLQRERLRADGVI